MNPIDPDSRDVTPERLSQMLSLDGDSANLWMPEELRDILRHQLEVPLDLELFRHDERSLAGETGATGSSDYSSLAALLADPEVAPALLSKLKDYTKAASNNPDSPLPEEIATTLYFAAIAAALVHHRKRISGLGDDGLRWGFRWALGQRWMADSLRPLFDGALRLVEGKS